MGYMFFKMKIFKIKGGGIGFFNFLFYISVIELFYISLLKLELVVFKSIFLYINFYRLM